ncbi:unnamed protein product [Oikopleura dioica]|uniref:Uncharacterized protein n=1 Tax=Oikopleura dioica TaxID=34765 RepID=E4XBV7_OIKDI|nr:unnamed protein product [Oikopleura dioica]
MPITGEFNVLPSFSQNRLLFSSQELKSVEDIIHDAFSRDLDVLLCQDMNTLPTDFINSNTTYLCDDRILLQNLENNPSSGDCCTWSHHQTKCGECTGELSYIALTKGECNWDRASGDIYEYASNDGQKYDTYFCNVKASFDQASKICSSFGGRLFNEDVLLWGDTSSLISTRRSCS